MLNTPFPLFRKYELGDMLLLFLQDGEQLAWTLIPVGSEDRIPLHRDNLRDTVAVRNFAKVQGGDYKACRLESMAQYHLKGDPFPNDYSAGETLRSVNCDQMKFSRIEAVENRITVVFEGTGRAVELHTVFSWRTGGHYLKVHTEFFNHTAEEITLDFLEAFSLSFLSLYHSDEAPDALTLHRYRSHWSAEGRHEERFLEDLGLEPAQTVWIQHTERWGQKSTLTAKQFFPAAGLEDRSSGVCWGAQLAVCGPWQMMASRRDDFAILSGGDPDGEFAAWEHILRPGESYTSPTALLSCVQGSMQRLLQRLAEYPVLENTGIPGCDRDWPVIFNEYCSSWGRPYGKTLLPQIEALKGSGVRYFVLDAGWFRDPDPKASYRGIGDWNVFEAAYPEGFDRVLEKIREAGFIPGVWFEFESVSRNSHLFEEHPEWLIHIDGRLYEHGRDRYFLDFRKPEVRNYLDEKVIGFLKKHRIGYMKVDYNATLHQVESANGSLSDGVRELLAEVQAFYRHIRAELPELVLEICASGGYRLTPEWMRLGTMASFSDAAETNSVPLIAARTSFLIPYRSNQVWVTLRTGEEPERTFYLLASGFLGRFCVSGDVDRLSDAQNDALRKAISLYQQNLDILRQGVSELDESGITHSWNHPRGVQVFRRKAGCGELIVVHTFADGPETRSVPLDFQPGSLDVLAPPGVTVRRRGCGLEFSGLTPFCGVVAIARA